MSNSQFIKKLKHRRELEVSHNQLRNWAWYEFKLCLLSLYPSAFPATASLPRPLPHFFTFCFFLFWFLIFFAIWNSKNIKVYFVSWLYEQNTDVKGMAHAEKIETPFRVYKIQFVCKLFRIPWKWAWRLKVSSIGWKSGSFL